MVRSFLKVSTKRKLEVGSVIKMDCLAFFSRLERVLYFCSW